MNKFVKFNELKIGKLYKAKRSFMPDKEYVFCLITKIITKSDFGVELDPEYYSVQYITGHHLQQRSKNAWEHYTVAEV